MNAGRRLLDLYCPPEGFLLQSLIASTYRVDWAFLEEELLPTALGVTSGLNRITAFRADLERRLQLCEVSILYDLAGSNDQTFSRISPRIDPIPVSRRKLHAKITLLMWSAASPKNSQPLSCVRLLVGSANLTQQGFRYNYEAVAAFDFGPAPSASPSILRDALRILREIAQESSAPQIHRQLAEFQRFADEIKEPEAGAGQSPQIVDAHQIVPEVSTAWRKLSSSQPDSITLVSPFWPEGEAAAEPIAELVRMIGLPKRLEIVCTSRRNPDGNLLPVLPTPLVARLPAILDCPISVRPAKLNFGVELGDKTSRDPGEETEEQKIGPPQTTVEPTRQLHAKMIIVRGKNDDVVYAGSSNLTRRGTGMSGQGREQGGQTNWEAGVVYRLRGKEREATQALLGFAGDPIRLKLGEVFTAIEPDRLPEPLTPSFLEQVTARGIEIRLQFRDIAALPADLKIRMPDRLNPERFFVLYDYQTPPGHANLICELPECSIECENGEPLSERNLSAWVEVSWSGTIAIFPVRFDDKASLPPALGARRLTEAELLEYFLTGREPDADGSTSGGGKKGSEVPGRGADTSQILSYFVRRFVEALPGIEARTAEVLHSRPALDAVLRGANGVLEIAKRAVASLRSNPPPMEPQRTATAVGFELVELLALMRKCRAETADPAVHMVVDLAISECKILLDGIISDFQELREATFSQYQKRIGT